MSLGGLFSSCQFLRDLFIDKVLLQRTHLDRIRLEKKVLWTLFSLLLSRLTKQYILVFIRMTHRTIDVRFTRY